MEDKIAELISHAFDIGKVLLSVGVVAVMTGLVWKQNHRKHLREIKERLVDSSTALVSGKKLLAEQEMRIRFDLFEFTGRRCSFETYRRLLKPPFLPEDIEHFRKAGHLVALTHDECIITSTTSRWTRSLGLVWNISLLGTSWALAGAGVYTVLFISSNENVLSSKPIEAILAAQVYILFASIGIASQTMIGAIRRLDRWQSLSLLLKRASNA